MAISLGSVFVELAVNHGQFISGFSEAGLASRKFQRDFASAFSGIGDIASRALAPFGEFGARIGQTIGDIGIYGSAAARQLGGLGTAMGAIGTLGGLAAGAAVAVSAGALAMAAHATKAAGDFDELSQRTGVSVETLSGFAFVAKQVGVEQGQMVKGLEMLSKAAFAAGTAPAGAVNAFTRLGVAVRDANGQFRPTSDLLGDLADKFSRMPDGIVKTALAKQLLGRAGAALIPVLNQGRQGIQEWIDVAQSLGIIISTETAESAHKFGQTLNEIQAAGEGMSLQLMKELLPALQYLADELARAGKNGDLKSLIHDVAELTRITLGLGNTFFHAFEQIGVLLEYAGREGIAFFNLIGAGFEAIARASIGDFSGARQALSGAYKEFVAQVEGFDKDSRAIWEKNADFINGIYGRKKVNPYAGMDMAGVSSNQLARAMGISGGFAPDSFSWAEGILGSFKKKSTTVDIKTQPHADVIAETIAKLRAQTEEEAALANAISTVTANTIMATAAANAEKTIAETNARAKKENRSLSEAEKQDIRELTTLKAAYEAAYKDNKGIADFIQKTDIQTKSMAELAEAYKNQNALAIEQAAEAKKLEPFAKQVSDIQEVIAALERMGATDAQLAPLHSSLVNMQDLFGKAAIAVHQLALAEEMEALGKATKDIDFQTDALEKMIPAILGGAEALRQFNIEQAIAAFHEKNPLVDTGPLRSALMRQAGGKQMESAARQVAGSQPFMATLDEIRALQLLESEEAKYGRDTTAIDTLIYQMRIKYTEEYSRSVFEAQNKELLGRAKLQSSWESMIHDWDQAAFKVGTFGERTRAVFNEIALLGKQAGEKIAQAFITAYDGVTTQLAKLLTGQKTNFKSVFTGLAESITKAQVEKGLGFLTTSLGLGGLGLGGKPDGSSAKPFYVIMAGGGIPGLGGGGGGGFLGGLFGSLGGLFGKSPFGGMTGGEISGLFGGPSSVGTTISTLPDFLATGGDVTAGKIYGVGEEGPEWFVPKQSGRIVPGDKVGGTKNTSMVMNFHGFKDSDMFRRSSSQLSQQIHRQLSIAQARA